jgi:hypothetical protein
MNKSGKNNARISKIHTKRKYSAVERSGSQYDYSLFPGLLSIEHYIVIKDPEWKE